MAADFEQRAHEANCFLNTLSEALGTPGDKPVARRATRAIFRAIRERIPSECALRLLSALPAALKGLFADSWKSTDAPGTPKTAQAFLADVRQNFIQQTGREAESDEHTRRTMRAFLDALGMCIPAREFREVCSQLPKEITAPLIAGVSA